ncbi:MAG: type II toxin-antitoxin system VapC family toxin [Gammaproteobacteria bacterium]|nr:type II toxin-antitoxin system VapC family toxin [Gammaproteobacteria bacterium]MCY4228662.1 type II toxin-antitoxin system VapC family toxin [Gammaproteobacteria bacterium]MCY4314011.1 type II toxin-antitoxin system VapC family toxin [Gammaproteobacteria bacterium]
MRILLDTHIWLWSQEAPHEFGTAARKIILNEDSQLFVSSISSLEIARLAWGKRLTLKMQLRSWIAETLNSLKAETLPITDAIALAAYALPGEFHRDPADRILVATAVVHQLTLITADCRILEYPHVLSCNARL